MTDIAEVLELTDPSRPNWQTEGERPIRVHVWRPSGIENPPLILLSHGTGGAANDLAWLAEALMKEEFAVAGIDHHGNNWVDGYTPEGFAFASARPRDFSFVLEKITGVDLGRVGAVGFSLGGYTALALVGARLDEHVCRVALTGQVELPPLPEFPDLVEKLNAKYSSEALEAMIPDLCAPARDERVRAAFAIAPAIGPMIDAGSLGEIDRPVAIRYGEADDNSIPEINALYYGSNIPGADVRSVGADVGHYVFCGDEPDPVTGEVRPVPDPTGAKDRVAADAVAFFTKQLVSTHPGGLL